MSKIKEIEKQIEKIDKYLIQFEGDLTPEEVKNAENKIAILKAELIKEVEASKKPEPPKKTKTLYKESETTDEEIDEYLNED
jgi:phosphoribosylanthranilate isomerase